LSTKIEENDQISMCIQFLRDGNHEAVLEELDKYILEYPNDIRLLNDKGIILTKLGKYKEAKDSFDKALAINDEPNINENKATNSKNGIVWNNKGLTYCNNS
jgi:tetratricopeptide (TPR) repeat protein